MITRVLASRSPTPRSCFAGKQKPDLYTPTPSRAEAVGIGLRGLVDGLIEMAPVVGGFALAGVPGLLAGVATNVTMGRFHNQGSWVKGSAGALRGAVVLGLGAGLAALTGLSSLGPSLAVMGTVALARGAFEGINARKFRSLEMDQTRFFGSFLEKARESLGEPSLAGITEKTPRAELLRAVAQAVEASGPDSALAWAGQVATELTNSNDEIEIDGTVRRQFKIVHQEQKDGYEELTINGDQGPGFATIASVYLDQSLDGQPAAFAFFKGHELSHLRHRDTVAMWGQRALVKSLEEACQLDPAPIEWSVNAYNTRVGLQGLLRKAEFRADQEGLQSALAEGFSGTQILDEVTSYFLRFRLRHGQLVTSEGSFEDSHPPDLVRLDSLRKQLAVT